MILDVPTHQLKLTGVYKITNIITEKVYIGSTTNSFYKRWQAYKNCYKNSINRKFLTAINKYGIENFKFSVIELVGDNSITRAREEHYIHMYNAVNNGYNIKYTGCGGNGGANKGKKYPTPSTEIVLRRAIGISAASRGKQKSKSHCEAISRAKKGCKPTHSLFVQIYDIYEDKILTFNSATDAAKKLGCSLDSVCSLVRGKTKVLLRRFSRQKIT